MAFSRKLVIWAERYLPPRARLVPRQVAPYVPGGGHSWLAYFDAGYYVRRYADLASVKAPPFAHYMSFGIRELRNPHPLFDAKFYVHALEATLPPGAQPLQHYLTQGHLQGVDPHPLFHTRYYLEQRPQARHSANPLWDYLQHGAAMGISPHPLFDARFYVASYGSAPGVRQDPLSHFIEHGATGRYWPNPLFDATHYVRAYAGQLNPQVDLLTDYCQRPQDASVQVHPLFDAAFYVGKYPEAAGSNLLAHYMCHAATNDPNAFFDTAYYKRTNATVDFSKISPLVHFLRVGAEQKRPPSPAFDVDYYVRNNPQVVSCQMNPLLHFMQYGRWEGRKPHASFKGPIPSQRLHRAVALERPDHAPGLSEAEWASLGRNKDKRQTAVVDVIVPVYRGLPETLACLASVLKSAPQNRTPFALRVINDASPEPALSARLRQLSALGLFSLCENQTNLGFVRTVNAGMAQHPARDVVLLNSDTQVYGDWIDRLRQVATEDSKVSTVTPLSNNGTICSYPMMEPPCELALEIGFATLDQLARAANAGVRIAIPTAVGFCVYIARASLNAVGLFDAETFGRGYGEENDFSMRATAQGWRHVLAPEVFVFHKGSVSFGPEYMQRHRKIMRLLLDRHPTYATDVKAFIRADPVHAARRNLDIARIERGLLAERPTVLFISHNRGGGTERHVQEMRHWFEEQHYNVLFLRPHVGAVEGVRLESFHVTQAVNATFDMGEGVQPLTATLRILRVQLIHLHHTVDFSRVAPDFFRALSASLGVPLDVTLHDYQAFCPQVNLIDASGTYCGEPESTVCARCVNKHPPEGPSINLWDWRERYSRLLAHANRVYTPSQDTTARFLRHIPKANYVTRPHPDSYARRPEQPLKRGARQPLRVAVIGALGLHKGARLLYHCARDGQARNLPIQFCLVGHTCLPETYMLPNVVSTRAYIEGHLLALLAKQQCHVALFLSLWPETFSYTLSAAFAAKLYPIAFDLGAPAERIKRAQWGSLVPVSWMGQPGSINDYLLTVQPSPYPDIAPPEHRDKLYPGGLAEYYATSLPTQKRMVDVA